MDKKKLNKLVSAIMVGDESEIESLVAECAQNYLAERQDELHSFLSDKLKEVSEK